MKDYRYIRLNEFNFKELADLIKAVYAVDMDLEQLKKKYDTNRFGASYVGYFAYYKDSKTAAAYYGILPIKVKIGETILLAAQSGDTMTHPDHRNKGLFVELAKRTYELGQTLGVQFVFGFPNESSYPGLTRKLGWTHAYDMVSINLFVPTIPYSALIMKRPSLKTLHARVLFGLLKKLFEIPKRLPEKIFLSTKDNAGVLHDADFFEYKNGDDFIYLKHREVFLLLKVENNNLGIGALYNYENESDLRGALRRLKFVCTLLGIIRIRTYCSPSKLSNSPLRKYGFTKKSLAYCYINFNASEDLHNLEFTYLDYDTF